jgi:hypothetical protein
MFDLSKEELRIVKALSTPAKIQDFLDTLPINHEKEGETSFSPRIVLANKKAHCFEGALFAAAVLAIHGEKPLIMNLRTIPQDDDHAVALYERNGYWGAVSKTNHVALRFRDPVYKTLRELAASYFHEYFLNERGLKTLRAYSKPLNLRRFGSAWVTSEEPLWPLAHALRDSVHTELFPPENRKYIRHATPLERRAGGIVEWPESHPRT